jgi:tripartite ATP-independent transporter DctP family solute receptor
MKSNLERNMVIAAAALILALLPGCNRSGGQSGSGQPQGAQNQVFELKLAHQTPETEPYHIAALKFKDMVESKSGGRITVTIYPAGQLGYDRDIIEGLQFGTIDLAYVTSSPLGNFIPGFSALDMPFLFKGWDHVETVLQQPYMQDLYKTGEAKSLVPMALLPRGFRSVTNSKRPIGQASDFSGLKIRVIESPVFVSTFEALGAIVTAMSWGEVFTALQQGAIDAEENSINTIHNERLFEVQKYVSLTEHIFAMTTFVASKATYDKLPPDLQNLIRESAVEASRLTGQECREQEGDYTNRLIERGMLFNNIDKTQLRTLVQKVYDDFIAKSDPDVSKLIGNIEATN